MPLLTLFTSLGDSGFDSSLASGLLSVLLGLGDGLVIGLGVALAGLLAALGFVPILIIMPCPSKKVVGAKAILLITSRVRVRGVFRIKTSTSPF